MTQDRLAPDLPPDVREQLMTMAGDRHLRPPWVTARRLRTRRDATAVASVFALHPLGADAQEVLWLVRGVLRLDAAGAPVLGRVAVEPFTDLGVEVTGAVLRQVPLATIRNRALGVLRLQPGIVRAKRRAADAMRVPRGLTEDDVDIEARRALLAPSPEEAAWASEVAEAAARRPLKRGWQGYSSDFYRQVALRYLEIVATGDRNPTRTLQLEESKRTGRAVSYQAIRDRISKAKELGFLERAGQGRVSRLPGPNLYRKEEQ